MCAYILELFGLYAVSCVSRMNCISVGMSAMIFCWPCYGVNPPPPKKINIFWLTDYIPKEGYRIVQPKKITTTSAIQRMSLIVKTNLEMFVFISYRQSKTCSLFFFFNFNIVKLVAIKKLKTIKFVNYMKACF